MTTTLSNAPRSNPFSIKESLSQLDAPEANHVNSRLRIIQEALESNNLTLRDDSRLVFKVASSHKSIDIHDIVGEVHAIDFIFKNTSYGDTVQESLREYAKSIHDAFPLLKWSTVWEITRFYMVPVCKIDALLDSGFVDGIPNPIIV